VQDAALTDQWATLTLEMPNLMGERLPKEIFTKDSCRHLYKGSRCAYRGGLPTCDYTYGGTNGCAVHGLDSLVQRKVRFHPMRFGAFLGIPNKLRV
jgi:phage-related protein